MEDLQTDRLILRPFTLADAPFLKRLMNDPSWIQYIGDRGINNLQDAQQYLEQRILKSYQENGFGQYLVLLKTGNVPIGASGLYKRDYLEVLDVGFAFLPEHTGNGYAFEATKAVLDFGETQLQLKQVAAITLPDNAKSIRLLEKLGLGLKKTFRPPGETNDLCLYTMEF